MKKTLFFVLLFISFTLYAGKDRVFISDASKPIAERETILILPGFGSKVHGTKAIADFFFKNGFSEVVKLGDRWKGGMMLLQPADKSQKPKEVPVDVFFHKIVMLRDRLRVMEQKINASKLEEIEKVELQQYITRIYGSLTTFNVLFKSQSDYFVGEKTK